MNKRVLCALVGAAVCAVAHQASAEIPLASAKGWELSLDGRLNTFLSVAFGDALPAGRRIRHGSLDCWLQQRDAVILSFRTPVASEPVGFYSKRTDRHDTAT